MNFESTRSILFSDTLVSDIFITEYMPCADGEYIKVYFYCLFLAKYKRPVSINDLSKKLGIDISKVKQALAYWENAGVFLKKENGIAICDLKEKEVHKLYRPKLTSTPEEAKESTEKNIKRSQVITAINNMFFQGVMSPGWYMDIDTWFKKYQFEEDVMLALFKYCFDRHALNKNYFLTVAECWYNKGIKNAFQLDKYYLEYEKCNEIKKKIRKKLRLSQNLNEYQEAYIEKWVIDFGYDFEIIEIALKKTTAKASASFDYFDMLLTKWHQKGLKSIEQIQEEIRQFKQEYAKKDKDTTKNLENKHFNQTKNIDLSKFYDNLNSGL